MNDDEGGAVPVAPLHPETNKHPETNGRTGEHPGARAGVSQKLKGGGCGVRVNLCETKRNYIWKQFFH